MDTLPLTESQVDEVAANIPEPKPSVLGKRGYFAGPAFSRDVQANQSLTLARLTFEIILHVSIFFFF